MNYALRRAVLSSDGKVLRIPSSGQRTRALPAELYILDAWKELYTIIRANSGSDKMVIVGTPGIGTTQFKYYVMYRLLQENPYQTILLQSDSGEVTVVSKYGDWDIPTTSVLLPMQHAPLLADLTVALEPAYSLSSCCAYTIVFASPSLARFKRFRRESGATPLILEPWTLHELLDARRRLAKHAEVTEDQVVSQFEIYGGIPRYVFERRYWGQRYMKEALAVMGALAATEIFASEVFITKQHIHSVDEDIAHRVLHIYRTCPDDPLRGWGVYLPASQFVVEQLLDTHPRLAVDDPAERGALLTVFRCLFARSITAADTIE